MRRGAGSGCLLPFRYDLQAPFSCRFGRSFVGFQRQSRSAWPALGLQLYTINDALRRDFYRSLQTVAAIGYQAVETNLTLGGRDALQLKRIFADLGLAWESVHCAGDDLLANLGSTIGAAHLAELKYIICAFPPIPGSFQRAIAGISLDDWKRNAALFSRD
jgi:hypothetical protein